VRTRVLRRRLAMVGAGFEPAKAEPTGLQTDTTLAVWLYGAVSVSLSCAHFRLHDARSVHVSVHAFGRERSGQAGGVVVLGDVVQVAHRGLDVGVAHPCLDPAQVDALRGALRAERVPEIVKDDRLRLCAQVA
jgi:hypothetical protein